MWENKKIKVHDTWSIGCIKIGDIITVRQEGRLYYILTINGIPNKDLDTTWGGPDAPGKDWEIIEESPLMEIGKWYEFSSLGSPQIGKVESITELHITCSPWIINKNTFDKFGIFFKKGVFKHPIKELKEEDGAIQKFIPKTSLSSFPSEGFCITKDMRLARYLVNRPNSKVSGDATPTNGVGLGWNSLSHWWLKTVDKSAKTKYEFSDLEKFLPFEPKIWLNVGDWIKNGNSYRKVREVVLEKGDIPYSEHITDGTHFFNNSTCYYSNSWKKLESLDEIQKYLPINHPNKLLTSEFKSLKNRYVKVIGKWGCGLVQDGDIVKVLEDKENSECIQIEKYLGCSRERLKIGELELMPEGYSPKEKKESVNVLPEYVECITDRFSAITLGGIYKIASLQTDRYSLEGTKMGTYTKKYFKPSTKEAYDAKYSPKIEKWIPQVGEWAKCIGETNHSKLFRMCSGGWAKDRVAQITRIEDHSNAKIIWLEGGYGVWFFLDHIRKALPEEIPGAITHAVKEDLLEEAKRRYPIGTKHLWMNDNGHSADKKHLVTTDREPKWISEFKSIDAGLGYIYANGKWAEIISTPAFDVEKIEERIEELNSKSPEHGLSRYVELLAGFDATHVGEVFDTSKFLPSYTGWNYPRGWKTIEDHHAEYFKAITEVEYLQRKGVKNVGNRGIYEQIKLAPSIPYDKEGFSLDCFKDFINLGEEKEEFNISVSPKKTKKIEFIHKTLTNTPFNQKIQLSGINQKSKKQIQL